MPALHGVDVLQHLTEGQRQIGILETNGFQLCRRLATGIHGTARVHPVIQALTLGLTFETIRHRLHGVGLVGLFFEFEFHGFLCNVSANFYFFSAILWSLGTPQIILWSVKHKIGSANVFIARTGSTTMSEHFVALGQIDQSGEAQCGRPSATPRL